MHANTLSSRHASEQHGRGGIVYCKHARWASDTLCHSGQSLLRAGQGIPVLLSDDVLAELALVGLAEPVRQT